MTKGKYNTPVRNLIEQPRMHKLFQLLSYLMAGKRTYDEIAERLTVSKRTAYRYVDLLESVGFDVERDWNGHVFLTLDDCPLCGEKHLNHNQQPL